MNECKPLMAGQDECARLNDEQRQVNIDFSNHVMRMVGRCRLTL